MGRLQPEERHDPETLECPSRGQRVAAPQLHCGSNSAGSQAGSPGPANAVTCAGIEGLERDFGP
jgi:hypothetical protein